MRRTTLRNFIGTSADRCHRCNAHLTRPESVREWFGPVCIHEALAEAALKIWEELQYKKIVADILAKQGRPEEKKKTHSDRKKWTQNIVQLNKFKW